MNVFLWIVAVLLAVAFGASGAMKLTQPKEKLQERGMGWVEDFSPTMVKLIGGLEVLAAIGLILPAALGVVPVLVPLAAIGLVAIMIGAILTHVRRKEPQIIVANVILLALAAAVAIGRLGAYSFDA